MSALLCLTDMAALPLWDIIDFEPIFLAHLGAGI